MAFVLAYLTHLAIVPRRGKQTHDQDPDHGQCDE